MSPVSSVTMNTISRTTANISRILSAGTGRPGLVVTSHLARNDTVQHRTMASKAITLENLNPNLVKLEYAVRGPLVIRAAEIEKELEKGAQKPFKRVIKANIGDAHAMGQVPITFIRQVLACVVLPDLIETGNFPADVKQKAKDILSGCGGGSVGSYSVSHGIELIRRNVAKYIEERDGHPSNWQNVCLSAGASTSIKNCLQMLCNTIDGKPSGVMIPIPQYPLYSASLAEYALQQVHYYLDEDHGWGLDVNELERSLSEASKSCAVRAIVVINPGNPTGQVLTRENIESVIKFAHKHGLFILADEVYQHNIYADGSKFYSFKKVLTEMGEPYSKLELASFMSVSKGYMGECGLRGGWVELLNIQPEVQAHLYKTISAMLCPAVTGQVAVDCVAKPPKAGEPSYDLWLKEKTAVLESLRQRAEMVANTFNGMPGFQCNPLQGAMYAFPCIELPAKAIEVAKSKGMAPDVYYAFSLLEQTGICIVPGTGFGQRPGTYHFRTTILPQPALLQEMLDIFKSFHEKFTREHSGGSVGSYSVSHGIELIRRNVAKYIEERDGHPSNWQNVCLSAGASTSIKNCLQMLCNTIDGKPSGVMIPIPQYPLYSASLAEYALQQVHYYLDEDHGWGLDVNELERSLSEASKSCAVRAIVVINPGNPTGQVLTRENIESVIKFAHKHGLFILADEVYQHNIYADGSKFYSFKKVLTEMGEPYSKLELASFMSVSKGYMGECGLRGGWVELLNIQPEVQAHLYKTISAMLCPAVTGQVAVDCVAKPPKAGEPSYDLWLKEKTAVLESLRQRAEMVANTFNGMPGFQCNPLQGAMYAFPCIELPAKAIEVAKSKGMAPDVYYAFSLLEQTGICIVPGTGFGQRPGTYHFRTTILPQPALLQEMLDIFKSFHEKFTREHSGGSVGSYSVSHGIELIRRNVAKYIEERDGHPSNWQNVCLSAGASTSVKNCLQMLCNTIDGKPSGVMIPIPQYPLYSASLAEYALQQVHYYLDEDHGWGLDVNELERSLSEASKSCAVRAIVVINPGNPTGQVLTRENIESVIKFAHKHGLFILADEVYQHNIYADGSKFYSFKKVLTEMGEPYFKLELASFMSVSKGYMGECGLRGGWVELLNIQPEVQAHLYKTISAMLCPAVTGQVAVDCVAKPPKAGEPSYDLWLKEKTAVLESLRQRAEMVANTFNGMPGFQCNPLQGAMYAFPRIELPAKAIEVAKSKGMAPDVYYAFSLLEQTGICIVPGTGFGQRPGTYHFRTTILPQPALLQEMLDIFKSFHEKFTREHS